MKQRWYRRLLNCRSGCVHSSVAPVTISWMLVRPCGAPALARTPKICVLALLIGLPLGQIWAFDSGVINTFQHKNQRLIEARIVGVDEAGVVLRGKDSGVVIVPLAVAAKEPQIRMRAGEEIAALLGDSNGVDSISNEQAERKYSRHHNGEVLFRSSGRSSTGTILVDNPTASDAIVKIVSPKRKYTFITIFVAASHEALVRDVFPTNYKVIFALGEGWGRENEAPRTRFFAAFRDLVEFPDIQYQKAYLQLRANTDGDSIDFLSHKRALHEVVKIDSDEFDQY